MKITTSEDTVMRSRRWDFGPFRLVHCRVPPAGIDPYGIGFDQHDDRNYPRTYSWSLIYGRLRVEIDGRDRRA